MIKIAFLWLLLPCYGVSCHTFRQRSHAAAPLEKAQDPYLYLGLVPMENWGNRFYDYGDLGLSDITIDAPPLREQMRPTYDSRSSRYSIFNGECNKKRMNARELYQLRTCFKKALSKELTGQNLAVGLCQRTNQEFVVHPLISSQDPTQYTILDLTSALDLRCRAQGGRLISSFVAL